MVICECHPWYFQAIDAMLNNMGFPLLGKLCILKLPESDLNFMLKLIWIFRFSWFLKYHL